MMMNGKDKMGGMAGGGMPMEKEGMGGMEHPAGEVMIAKAEDGTFTVNGKPAKTIDEALAMVRELLTGDDGGMSVEQAFQRSFRGDSGMGPMGGMGGGY